MIYSEKQYSLSKAQLNKFQKALLKAEEHTSDRTWLEKAEIDAIKSQIADIKAEIDDYDLLKSKQISFAKTYSLENLPRVLVQARIASGMSQTDLAKKLEMKPQQIQRYEASGYLGASLAKLIKVSRELGIEVSGAFEGAQKIEESLFIWNDIEDISWRQFPYNEMIKRNWFVVPYGRDKVTKIKEYFLDIAGPQFVSALHRKKMRGSNVPNEYALLAWQVRILELAQQKILKENLSGEFDWKDDWLPELVSLTKQRDGPKQAQNLLARKGIILVIEQHLPGTYLDGAAMLAENGTPVIGLTLRYDRRDNFWFVLMHELGHVYLHLLGGQYFDFFDDDTGKSDGIEAEADQFALDNLIPETKWNQCLSRFALSEESVRIDANNIGIDPSIIAGRIRKELDNYTILNSLVGQDQVRTQFEESSDNAD